MFISVPWNRLVTVQVFGVYPPSVCMCVYVCVCVFCVFSQLMYHNDPKQD